MWSGTRSPVTGASDAPVHLAEERSEERKSGTKEGGKKRGEEGSIPALWGKKEKDLKQQLLLIWRRGAFEFNLESKLR